MRVVAAVTLALLVHCPTLADDLPEVPRTAIVAVDTASLDDNYNSLSMIPKDTVITDLLCLDTVDLCLGTVSGARIKVKGSALTVVFDGKAMDAHAAARAFSTVLATQFASGPTTTASDDIVAWGDSFTSGAGASSAADSYTSVARSLLYFRRIANMGVGGQSSTSIAARMNAIPTALTLQANTIPPSGSVQITGRTTTPITNQGPSSLRGTLCGVEGVLSAATGDEGKTYVYSFARNSNGSAADCPPMSVISFADPIEHQGDTAWLWLGRNGADPGRTVLDDVAAAVASLATDRYLVGSLLPDAAEGAAGLKVILAINADLKRQYGKRYVDILSPLLAGGNGSEGDQSDVQAGIPPRSLRSDSIHPNDRGYAIVAHAFASATNALGY